MKTFTFSLETIKEVAQEIVSLDYPPLYLLKGDMGAGKTTFVKAIASAYGVTEATSSPTFSIVNEYRTANNSPLYHFDLYRLDSLEEALDIGIEDYLYSGAPCFIEWPEKISSLLPETYSIIELEVIDEATRKLNITLCQQ